jgi:predicted nucleic acid-binding Zn ribbon protein
MECPRCGAAVDKRGKWCRECEAAFDKWVRQHATDIVWATLAGGIVLGSVGMILPLLGADWILAAGAAFAGWGTIVGLYRWNSKRRRRQFLAGGDLPRAYLPEPK